MKNRVWFYLGVACLAAVPFVARAQDKPVQPAPHFTLWTTSYCYSWGDPLGYVWTQCEQPIRVVQVEKVVERVVEKRIEVPVPAPLPAPPKKAKG